MKLGRNDPCHCGSGKNLNVVAWQRFQATCSSFR
ncbi:MAG: SEC-C metal-binding domain-containing protein [Pontibacterium sp.]